MEDNIKVISFGDKTIKLKLVDFEDTIVVEDILRIDYANIMGEVLTFSAVLNRLGLLLADVEDALRRKNFLLETSNDELKKIKGKAYSKAQSILNDGATKSPTVSAIEKKLMEDDTVLAKEESILSIRKHLLDVQRDRDYINSLYWSAKDKSEKLNKITDKIRPEEFSNEILEGTINGVMIKVREKLIK